jgi:hypothetical protein
MKKYVTGLLSFRDGLWEKEDEWKLFIMRRDDIL